MCIGEKQEYVRTIRVITQTKATEYPPSNSSSTTKHALPIAGEAFRGGRGGAGGGGEDGRWS